MAWFDRFRNLWRRDELSGEIDEELSFHVDSRTADNIARGMSPPEARRQAEAALGRRTLQRERAADENLVLWAEVLLQDLRFAIRMMRRFPLFSAAAVLLIAIGIAASTSVFSVLGTVVFPRPEFANAGRVVYFWRRDLHSDNFDGRLPYADLARIRQLSRTLQYLTAWRRTEVVLTGHGDPQPLVSMEVQRDWLAALGVQPARGRAFLPGETDAALLTDSAWRKLLHANPTVLGMRITVNGRASSIVGILPPRFVFEDASIITPLVENQPLLDATVFNCHALALLRHEFTEAQAQQELDAIVAHLPPSGQPGEPPWTVRLASYGENRSIDCGPTCEQANDGLWILFGAAALVLLVASANVANLLLARALSREREFLIRNAIGCTRWRLVRQVFTESCVLFLAGGVAGVLLALWCNSLLGGIASTYTDQAEVHLDARALLFAAAVTLISALTFGILPAFRSSRGVAEAGLREHGASHSRRRTRVRSVLVTVEFSFALVLLAGFGLLLRSLRSVESIPLGFNSDSLLTTWTRLRGSTATQRAFADNVLRRIEALPGATSVALTSSLPLTGADATRVEVEGITPPDPRGIEVRYLSVSAGLFRTLKIPILNGRALTEFDMAHAAGVVVINETMARQFFGNTNPIGRRIRTEGSPRWRQIVGIAGDVRQRNLEEDSRPVFYQPYTEGLEGVLQVAVRVRSRADMPGTAEDLRNAVRAAGPDQPWDEVISMERLIADSESLSLRRPVVRILGFFGALALALAITGLYAVLAWSVAERRREIGIRMALGATREEILGLIAAQVLRATVPGAVIGAVISYLLSGLLPSGHIGWSGSGILLYGISRSDPATYACVAVVLLAVSALAGFIPARRAIRTDPAATLRCD